MLGTALDITERRRAEQALRESEQNLRTLASNANDGMLVHVNGRIVFANRRLAEIMGSAPEELLGLSAAELVRNDEVERIRQRWKSRLLGEQVPDRYETMAVHKNGSGIAIEISAALTVWQGSPAIIVIVRDIATRKRAEAELFREEERLQVTHESIGDGLITTDIAGRIEYLNPVAEELIGWQAAEAAGRPLHEVFRVFDENTAPASAATAASAGAP